MSQVKYNRNISIEEFIKDKEKSAQPFTKEDLAFINEFIGYGGMAKFGATGKGLLSEYFTPYLPIEKMVGLAIKYGYKMGDPVLEPSCGVGRILHYFSPRTKVDAFEINEVSYKIAKLNFPTFNIQNKYFNELFIDRLGKEKSFRPKYKLVIGNPPYGDFTGKFTVKERKKLKAKQYEDYFITRSLDLLLKDGLLVFIVPSRFLNSNDSIIKERIFKSGILLDAYRLPKRIFEQTDVQTDIIVMRKK